MKNPALSGVFCVCGARWNDALWRWRRRWWWSVHAVLIVLSVGDSRGLKVGDLPGAGGSALVDAGVAVGAGDIAAFAGCINFCAGCDDCDRSDNLDFAVA